MDIGLPLLAPFNRHLLVDFEHPFYPALTSCIQSKQSISKFTSQQTIKQSDFAHALRQAQPPSNQTKGSQTKKKIKLKVHYLKLMIINPTVVHKAIANVINP